MSTFKAMTERVPFANGTEGEAWMGVWCDYCVHDHDMHTGRGGGCDLILMALAGACDSDSWRWPEAWVPEPPSLGHNLPALMLCGQFEPCQRGDCEGDPHAEVRVEVTARVKAAWDEDRKRGAAA